MAVSDAHDVLPHLKGENVMAVSDAHHNDFFYETVNQQGNVIVDYIRFLFKMPAGCIIRIIYIV